MHSNRHMRKLYLIVLGLALLSLLGSGISPSLAHATTIPNGDFSIEVSPSPLAATVKPGQATTIELRIRNASTNQEQLAIESRDFTMANNGRDITIDTKESSVLKDWVTYSEPTFTVAPGSWFTQKITLTLPDEAGFSYPFAIVISRANEANDGSSGRFIRGSVAVFTLINVDKPGASRKLELDSFTTSQPIYEYLPATLRLKLKNTGNTIVQPYGNFYIQGLKGAESSQATLSVNDTHAYILPGTTKELDATWSDGYPVYVEGTSGQHVDWDIAAIGHFRMGRYTAKVVAAYNDGTRDVPIVGEVTFWVIPWKILLVAFILLCLIGLGAWSITRRIIQRIKTLGKPKRA